MREARFAEAEEEMDRRGEDLSLQEGCCQSLRSAERWPTIAGAVTAPTSGRPSLRSLRGLVCPRCYQHLEESAENIGRSVLRCPRDGAVLVTTDALAAADGDPFLGAVIAGRYAILSKLGAGSMGTVYRARREGGLCDVAVKIVRTDRLGGSSAKARFMREVRAMSMLRSPYTVTVHDFGEVPSSDLPGTEDEPFADGAPVFYLAMELLLGESLGDRLAQCSRLSVEESLGIARHALLSLAEAHDKGVIHRDLKPDNLFLTVPGGPDQEEICKLLDFGIAKIAGEKTRGVDAAETQEGVVFGTPRYMSPEQAQGKAVDARSDLYTLGVLLYQMLVGEPPFADDEAVVVMAHHIKTQPVPPALAAPDAGIPADVSDLVLRALSKDPSRRPQSAREFIDEIDRVMLLRPDGPAMSASGVPETCGTLSSEVTELNTVSTPPSRRGKNASSPGSRVARWLVVMLAVVCGVTAGIFMFELWRPRSALVAPSLGGAITGLSAELEALRPNVSGAVSAEPIELGDIEADDTGAASNDAGAPEAAADAGALDSSLGESAAPLNTPNSAKWPAPSQTVRPPPFRPHRRFNSER